MALKHVGAGKFVDDEPVSEEDLARHAPKEWRPRLKPYRIYPWVEFYSLETAGYGLLATEGTHDAEPAASVEVGEQRFDPSTVAPLAELSEVLETMSKGRRYLVEEFPFAEIKEEDDYDHLLAVCLEVEVPESPKQWSPRVKKRIHKESKWEGPGVYDARDCPPTRHSASAEDYELEGMEYWADDTLDYMFQGDEWKESLKRLLGELSE